MPQLRHEEPYSLMYVRNVVLWRPCYFEKGELRFVDVDFTRTKRGTFLCKVNTSQHIWEPVISPYSYNGCNMKGITVFVDTLPDSDWTHIQVTGVSNSLRDVSNPKGCIFATTVKPYDKYDYLDFRLNMLSARAELEAEMQGSPDFATILEASTTMAPSEARTNIKRLVFLPVYRDPYIKFIYEHVK